MKRLVSLLLIVVIMVSVSFTAFAASVCPYCQRTGYVEHKKVFEMFYYQLSGNYIREVYVYNTYDQCGACYKKWNYDTVWEYGPWFFDSDNIG